MKLRKVIFRDWIAPRTWPSKVLDSPPYDLRYQPEAASLFVGPPSGDEVVIPWVHVAYAELWRDPPPAPPAPKKK